MIIKYVWQKLAAVILFVLLSFSNSFAEAVQTDLSLIDIRADHSEVAPGQSFYVVIELTPNVGWHAYWENPGDAGLKLTMSWDLPEGVTVSDLEFTTPHLIPFEEIVSYGYDGKATIIAEASIAENVDLTSARISGQAFWLVCSDELCVPQEAAIGFDLPIGESTVDPMMSAVVESAKNDMPVEADWETSFYTDGENFQVVSQIPEEYPVIESAYLFPHTEGMMENVYRQDLSFINGQIVGRFKNAYGYADNDNFRFVLSFKTGDGESHAYFLNAGKSEAPLFDTPNQVTAPAPATDSEFGIATALLFAFLGGMILNLMPCVFPILSLKAMSVAALSNKDAGEAKVSGLLYTAGILICFGLIGAIVNILSVGWGFHMQIPLVNFTLGLLMVAIGLNLLGVFEFGGSFVGVGQSMTESDGTKGGARKSAFFTGVLAVVVATPCTAPFMASALGYAFISGGITGLLIFLALGFGLAFPYLLICYVPGVRNALPRPGAWMETMKNILGFPMLATALWLFWILGNQVGVDGMTVAIIASLFLGLLLWSQTRDGLIFKLLMTMSAAGVLYAGYFLHNSDGQSAQTVTASAHENEVPFSSAELDQILTRNEAVFVYFTADWCVTCKLNERVALSQPSVRDAFADKGVTVMVGDWTNQNPDITKTLQSYGRIGVPLYLYFPEGRAKDNPDILPQILTPDIVIDAL